MIAIAQKPQSQHAILQAARISGLLTPMDCAAIQLELPPTTQSIETLNWLVDRRMITRFQADRLLAGKTDGFVVGAYLILDQLSDGTVSRLYLARHRTMDRLVAIKVLSTLQSRNPASRISFQESARGAAKLTHPNIVTILDVNEVGERVYVVQEYVEGTSLGAWVRGHGTMPVDRTCEFLRQAALGLHYAHEQGRAHGRLDPLQILIGYPGGVRTVVPIVKVAGFDLFPGAGRNTDYPDIDPLDYRAPELCWPSSLTTPTSDLYSLGCLFYFVLTGHPPFGGRTPEEKADEHQTSTPTAIELLRPDVPPGLADIIRQLLRKDPGDRWLSAAELADRLEPFLPVDVIQGSAEGGVGLGLPSREPTGYLSGLVAKLDLDEPSPWSGLEDGTLDEAASRTSRTTPRPNLVSSGSRRVGLVAALIAGTCIMVTLVAVLILIQIVSHR